MSPEIACSTVAVASSSEPETVSSGSSQLASSSGVTFKISQPVVIPRQSRRTKRAANASNTNIGSDNFHLKAKKVTKKDETVKDEQLKRQQELPVEEEVKLKSKIKLTLRHDGNDDEDSNNNDDNSNDDADVDDSVRLKLQTVEQLESPSSKNTPSQLTILTPPSPAAFQQSLPPIITSRASPATPPQSPKIESSLSPCLSSSPSHSLSPSSPPSIILGTVGNNSLTPNGGRCTIPPLQDPINITEIACKSTFPSESINIPLISAQTLVSAIDFHYSQPLPDVDSVFPWMHGLHPHNIHQRAFLDPLKRYRDTSGIYFDLSQVNEELLNDEAMFKLPDNVRGLIVIKVGDESNLHGTLVGTVTPGEVLAQKRASTNDEWSEYSFTTTTTTTTTETTRIATTSSVTTITSTDSPSPAVAADSFKNATNSSISNNKTANGHAALNGNASSNNTDNTKTNGSINNSSTSNNNSDSDSDVDMMDSDMIDSCPFVGKFLYLDPPEGISLRNFQIQVSKWATLSDICVYAPNPQDHSYARKIAQLLNQAQIDFRRRHPNLHHKYNSFVCDASIEDILSIAPHIVSIPPQSHILDEDEVKLKNWDSNFLFHERVEMSMMSSASQIGNTSTTVCSANGSSNDVNSNGNGPSLTPKSNGFVGGGVWLGNTVDFETYIDMCHSPSTAAINESIRTRNWATFIECFEGPQLPPFQVLDQYITEAASLLESESKNTEATAAERSLTPLSIQFPSSGSISLSECNEEVFLAIVSLCKLLYLRSKVQYRGSQAGVLIYCNDGYTETSLLALAYLIYSTGVSSAQAWIDLHVKFNRPFFCFTMDVLVIMALEKMLLEHSPAVPGSKFNEHGGAVFAQNCPLQLSGEIPPWFAKLDGSLPSKILPHMYLGSLQHAENPDMLAHLGIKRVLSVGETLSWMDYDHQDVINNQGGDNNNQSGGCIYIRPHAGIAKAMYMDNIQDDGVDALTSSLATCLQYLDEGYRMGEPTLVHCRVGVSRSATVCIAEVMKRLSVGLPRAYLFVRVRRLNVIIQPNLRFMYELVKWEEMNRRNGEGWLREVDWHVLCREISVINKVYIS